MWRPGLVLSDIVASPRPSSDNVCVSAGPLRCDMHYSLRLSKLHLICESAVRVSPNDMLIAVETLNSLSRSPWERKRYSREGLHYPGWFCVTFAVWHGALSCWERPLRRWSSHRWLFSNNDAWWGFGGGGLFIYFSPIPCIKDKVIVELI